LRLILLVICHQQRLSTASRHAAKGKISREELFSPNVRELLYAGVGI
jgi:hypothetical protein